MSSISWEIVGDEIHMVETVVTRVQTAVIRIIGPTATMIQAEYVNGILRAEYRRPVIPNSPFSGQLVDTETRPMLLRVDDSEPTEIAVTNGIAEVPLEFETPGTYHIAVEAGFPCEPARLEVTV